MSFDLLFFFLDHTVLLGYLTLNQGFLLGFGPHLLFKLIHQLLPCLVLGFMCHFELKIFFIFHNCSLATFLFYFVF